MKLASCHRRALLDDNDATCSSSVSITRPTVAVLVFANVLEREECKTTIGGLQHGLAVPLPNARSERSDERAAAILPLAAEVGIMMPGRCAWDEASVVLCPPFAEELRRGVTKKGSKGWGGAGARSV